VARNTAARGHCDVTDRLRSVPRRAPRPSGDPLGKAALFSRAAADPAPSPAAPDAPTRWRPCTVELHCRACVHRTRVGYVRFVALNLPPGWWLPIPGMHFNRFMTCPACGERTWVHASWLP
jgi:hypothetical protein